MMEKRRKKKKKPYIQRGSNPHFLENEVCDLHTAVLQALPLIQLNIPRVQLMIDRLKIAQGGARTLDLLVFIYFFSLSLSLNQRL